jgi:hypothetical protein
MRSPDSTGGLGEDVRQLELPALRLIIGPETFRARLRTDLAPRTCAWLAARLPLRLTLLHARWSGEASWAPLDEADLGLPHEDATTLPAPGEALLYGGGVSEPEILIAYGATRFASKAGVLAGNPIFSIVEGRDRLAAIGRTILWLGAMDIEIARAVTAEDSQ